MPSPTRPNLRAQPMGVLYRDGLLNFNGEAARLLPSQAVGVRLLPPVSLEAPQWLLLPIYANDPAAARLYGNTARHCAPALVTALFAFLPAGQPLLRLQLVPTESAAFQLQPVG